MKKNIILIFCLTIFLFVTLSMCFAFGLKGEKALKNHPEFISIENEWGEKLGTHYLVNLTGNRILEFAQIDSGNGGGKYAGLKGIGEFGLTGQVDYIDGKYHSWKDTYGSHVRFQDLSQLLGIKIENMIDCIENYDKILGYVQMLAREQYLAGYEASFKRARKRRENPDNLENFPYHFVLSEKRNAMIAVSSIYGYSEDFWHGTKEEDFINENIYSNENRREKLNKDLPKIRKSLGLE